METEPQVVEATRHEVLNFLEAQLSEAADVFVYNRLRSQAEAGQWKQVADYLRGMYQKFFSQPLAEQERSTLQAQMDKVGEWLDVLDREDYEK